MNLAIALRVYPGISRNPFVHGNNKLDLVECSCRSLIGALKGIDYKLYLILDSCPGEYRELFLKIFPVDSIVIHEVDKMGNMGTFGLQIDLLLKQSFSDFVLFAEDDYLYAENAFAPILQVLNEKKADFVTPYDHPDYYSLRLHQDAPKPYKIGDKQWHEVGSTCLTFFTRKDILQETHDLLRSYSRRNSDAAMWFAMTKQGVFNPLITIPVALSNKFFLRHYYLLIKHGLKQILFGKRYKLLSPIPSLATHMESEYLAAEVDWMKIAKDNEPRVLA